MCKYVNHKDDGKNERWKHGHNWNHEKYKTQKKYKNKFSKVSENRDLQYWANYFWREESLSLLN